MDQDRKDHPGCREFTDVTVYEGTVEVTNPRNPTAGSTKVKSGHKTTVPCGLLLGATSISGAAVSSSAGVVVSSAVLGAGAIASGVVVGIGTGGGFGGGGSGPAPTVRPTPPITGAR